MENTEKKVATKVAEVVNDMITVKVVDVYADTYNGEDKDGNKITRRAVYLTFDKAFDGIVPDGKDKFKHDKINRLMYSAYYLTEIAKANNKKVNRLALKMKERLNKDSISLTALSALYQDAELTINRKAHSAGEIYTNDNGEEVAYYADGYAKDIVDLEFNSDALDEFKDEINDDMMFYMQNK